MVNPKISIIIATFNASEFIERCLNSILLQKNNFVEVLVIDGGSNDTTVDIIRSSKVVDYWKSEVDNGIYDAWNKGLEYANGDWIMFLGADDYLLEGAIDSYLKFVDSLKGPLDYISCRIKVVDKKGRFISIRGMPWSWPRFLKETITAHPGSLHARSLFREYGTYNIDYRIVGDSELLMRPKEHLRYAFLDRVTVVMQEGGVSDSFNAIWEFKKASVLTGGASPTLAFGYALKISVKYLLKKVMRRLGASILLKNKMFCVCLVYFVSFICVLILPWSYLVLAIYCFY